MGTEGRTTGRRVVGAGALLCAAALVAGAGSIAVAMPSAIPDKGDGEVHVCYHDKQARKKDGGATLRIYDESQNRKKCLKGDKLLTLPTKAKATPAAPAKLAWGQVFTTADFVLASAEPTAVPGLSIVLPKAGTYAIDGDVRGYLVDANPAQDCFLSAQLALNNVVVPNSQRQVLGIYTGLQMANTQTSVPISQIVTVTGPKTLTVQGLRSACTETTAGIGGDATGRSSLRYVLISS